MPYIYSAANSTPKPRTGQFSYDDPDETASFWQQRLSTAEPGVVMPIDCFRRLARRAIGEARRQDPFAADLLDTIMGDKEQLATMTHQPVTVPATTARHLAGWAFPGVDFEVPATTGVVIALPLTILPEQPQQLPYRRYGA